MSRLWATALVVAALLVAGAAASRSWLSSHLVPRPTTAPAWWGTLTEVIAEAGVLALFALCVVLSSEGLKVLVAQPRPCHVERPLAEVAGCPAVTDYAFPSNHVTVRQPWA